MKPRTKALASTAAALTLTGCNLFGGAPSHKPLAEVPSTQPDLMNAERDAQIEALYGKPGERKNIQFGQLGQATTEPAPIADGILPLPKTPAPATQPRSTVAEVIARTAPPVDPNLTAMGTTPADPVKPTLPPEPTMEQLLGMLRKQVAASPKSLPQALALELLQLSDGGKPEDLTLMGLSTEDNKLVGDLASAVQTISVTPAGASSTLAERATPLVAAAKNWEASADLKIPTLALASRVDSFGIYTPVEGKFPSGKRSVVIIYCEVANFTSEKIGTDYVTRLTQQDSLVTADGLLAWRPNPEEVEDRCRNQRHDFYLIKKLTIPETLAVGKYTLRMTVTDTLGNKTDTGTLDIEIVK